MVSFFFNEHLRHLLDTTPAIRSSACIKSQFQRVVSGNFCRSKIPLFLVKSKFQLSPSMFSEKSPQHLLESPSTFWLESYGDNIFIIFHHKSKHPPSLTNQNYVFGCPFCIELEIRALKLRLSRLLNFGNHQLKITQGPSKIGLFQAK